MEWGSWGPTIIAVVTAVFIAGAYADTIRGHSKRLDAHETKLDDLGTRVTAAEAWREGYNAGRGK